MFLTPVAMGGALGPAAVSFLQATTSTTDLSTYTFAAQNLGVAAGNRKIICGICSMTATLVNSCSIGGISATSAFTASDSNSVAAFYIADVPTGTTGDVVFNVNATAAQVLIALYRVVNLVSNTPTSTGSDIVATTNAFAASLTIPADGFGIGLSWSWQAGGDSATWTNLTEDYDTQASTTDWSGAMSSAAGAATRTCQWSGAVGSDSGLILAAWR